MPNASRIRKKGASLLGTMRTGKTMETRRRFMALSISGLTGLALFPLSFVQWVWAETKKVILPKGTKRESLIRRNPAELDTRNLEVTRLKDFGTMGLTDHVVNPDTWRLEVTGRVKKPLKLNYSQIRDLPSIERTVLLICPGFFANHGRWRGISINELLRRAGVRDDCTHVAIGGPRGPGEKVVRYPIGDILSDKVFLAYGVNGKELPREHGFPLRVVAEDYYGYDWVKYADKVTAEAD